MSAIEKAMHNNNIHKNSRIKPSKKYIKRGGNLKKLFIGQYPSHIPHSQNQSKENILSHELKDKDIKEKEKRLPTQEIILKVKNSSNNQEKERSVSREHTPREESPTSNFEQNFGAAKKKLKSDQALNSEKKSKKSLKLVKNINSHDNHLAKIQEDVNEKDYTEKTDKKPIENLNIKPNSESIDKKIQNTKNSSITGIILDTKLKNNDPEYKQNMINKAKIEDFLNEEQSGTSFFKKVTLNLKY